MDTPSSIDNYEGSLVLPIGVGLCLIVTGGNLLVLYVLITQKFLHTSTNFIVLSLTISDLLLGLLILPLSILQEYTSSWLFGETLCKLWLALDVALSTASIYNLLAISLDRYMAVRQPIKYRLISSSRMTKITILSVWVISFSLSCPPLLAGHFGIQHLPGADGTDSDVCTPMTSADWYILFSASVSFIIPMLLMVCLNLSIFRTVVDSTKLSTGTPRFVKKKVSSTLNRPALSDNLDNLDGLRAHRGGGLSQTGLHLKYMRQTSHGSGDTPVVVTEVVAQTGTNGIPVRSYRKIGLSAMGNAEMGGEYRLLQGYAHHRRPRRLRWLRQIKRAKEANNQPPQGIIFTEEGNSESRNSALSATSYVLSTLPSRSASHTIRRDVTHCAKKSLAGQSRLCLVSQSNLSTWSAPGLIGDQKAAASENDSYNPGVVVNTLLCTLGVVGKEGGAALSWRRKKSGKPPPLLYLPTSNQQRSYTSLRTELRVARTITIVVGCFTLFWLPFTIIYVLQAFHLCPVSKCVPKWLFTVSFWMGYANSGLNPLLYASVSRDFRSAFRKVFLFDKRSHASKRIP